jgi:three-Cys-motif partner protein
MSKVAKRSSHSDYEKFKEYLFEMHERALRVYHRLSPVRKEYLRSYFEGNFKEIREHYWTLRKLYCLAMYIPMFLQIGMKHFDKVVYVDTHAGPGLAKIGEGEDELVLGSPLLAIAWPEIVASHNINFEKIKKGFDALYFIDIDSRAIDVLREAINYVTDDTESWTSKTKSYPGDANSVLLSKVKGDIEKRFGREVLVMLFIDPFGELESQLRYDVFREFVETFRTDVIFIVMSSPIARALSSKNGGELRKWVKELWGEICESDEGRRLSLCTFNERGPRRIGVNDIVDAYKAVLEQCNYKVKVFEVTYEKKVLYHLIVASRGDRWLDGYEKYIRERTPPDYKTLKNLFLQVRGKQAVL